MKFFILFFTVRPFFSPFSSLSLSLSMFACYGISRGSQEDPRQVLTLLIKLWFFIDRQVLCHRYYLSYLFTPLEASYFIVYHPFYYYYCCCYCCCCCCSYSLSLFPYLSLLSYLIYFYFTEYYRWYETLYTEQKRNWNPTIEWKNFLKNSNFSSSINAFNNKNMYSQL